MDGNRYLREHEDRIAWIMGSSRSGSTWLLRMLRELPAIVGVDDPHLGHHLGVWRPAPIAWATATHRPELTTLTELKLDKPDYFFSDRYKDAWLPQLRELVRARFGAQLEDRRPEDAEQPRLVVKEPGSHAEDMFFDAFPRSRLIFLLRDGRDVVDSWIDAYQRGSWAIDEGAFAVAPEGRLALVEWLSSVWAYRARAVGKAFDQRAAADRLLIRYEDLLADPPRELGRICETIGVDASVAELKAIAERHSFANVDDAQRGEGQEIRAAAPGSWRHNLAPDEQRAMDQIMGAELTAFGYRSNRAAKAA
jgi:LPS sulfotransferase NodH